jgi:hypothetical protein
MAKTDLEVSKFRNRPAYRYIRASDKLPLTCLCCEPVARIKLFDPTGSWTWYIASYDPDTRIAYGMVDGFEKEFGSFSMEELVEWEGRFGLPIERDLYFDPCTLKDLASFGDHR